MTVLDLIVLLLKQDLDAVVIVNGEDGYTYDMDEIVSDSDRQQRANRAGLGPVDHPDRKTVLLQ